MNVAGILAIPRKGLADVWLLQLHVVKIGEYSETRRADGLDDFGRLALAPDEVRLLAVQGFEYHRDAGSFDVADELFPGCDQQPFLNFPRVHQRREVLKAVGPGHWGGDQEVGPEVLCHLQAMPFDFEGAGALLGVGIQKVGRTDDSADYDTCSVEFLLERLYRLIQPFPAKFDSIIACFFDN